MMEVTVSKGVTEAGLSCSLFSFGNKRFLVVLRSQRLENPPVIHFENSYVLCMFL